MRGKYKTKVTYLNRGISEVGNGMFYYIEKTTGTFLFILYVLCINILRRHCGRFCRLLRRTVEYGGTKNHRRHPGKITVRAQL